MAEESRFDVFNSEFKQEDFVKVGETQTFVIEEEVIVLSLHDAADQALWDLRQWVKDHSKTCDCFTCKESIPDLERALGSEHAMNGPCC